MASPQPVQNLTPSRFFVPQLEHSAPSSSSGAVPASDSALPRPGRGPRGRIGQLGRVLERQYLDRRFNPNTTAITPPQIGLSTATQIRRRHEGP